MQTQKQKSFVANLKRLLDLRYPRTSLRRRAAALGLSPAYLSEILRGRVVPPAETVSRIAATLGVTPEVLTSPREELITPVDPFDFSFHTAIAWRWCLSAIERKLDDAAWRARFADAVVLFFFTAETWTAFPDPDEARAALTKTHEKIMKCKDFTEFEVILYDLFAFCGAFGEVSDDKEGFQEPEGELARRARTLVFHAFLFTEDPFSYLSSPSPLQFIHDEQRLAWVNHLALKKVLEFARLERNRESGREP